MERDSKVVPVNAGNVAERASLSGGPLLAESEPSPFRIVRPDGSSPFVFICDHASRRIPQSLGSLGLSETELSRHIAWDIGAAAVTERLSENFNATAAFQNYSRLVIDCNRCLEVFNSIPSISEDTLVPGNNDLGEAERQVRVDEIFTPYHNAISQILDDRAAQNRDTILVSVHSFTPLFKGFQRPWDFAVVYNRDPRLSHIVLDLLGADGDLNLGDNEPYYLSDETDYTLPVHGEQRHLPHTQFEIRQDLIETPKQQSMWADRLTDTLKRALEKLNKGNI
ncbi:MAG: N-formylglutamate amidohydrolase [Rhodospirillaceae bacterium]|nr:N-formylglutamate amidohydrolase [Rhodospirillaceae bacterium]MBL6940609.1 N-formylglutamate amidohydrolase [Rhodospirillales bacterium]